MSSRSDAGNIIINTASSGRRKNVARNEKDGVTHNGAGVHPSAVPDAKSTVAPMMVEKDSSPSGDQSNISNFGGNNDNSNLLPSPPNPRPRNTRTANDDDDESIRTPELDTSSHKSSKSRHSAASSHLVSSHMKICSKDNKVYVPETGGYICLTPKCNYILCISCADAAYNQLEQGEDVCCPDCKAALHYDVEADDAEAEQNADINLPSLMKANKDALFMLGKKLPKYISRTKLGLRKLRDAVLLTKGELQDAEQDLQDAKDAGANIQVITRLTLARDNANIAHRQAKLNEPHIKVLQDYLEVQDKIKIFEKDISKMRRNAENEQKLRVKMAMAEIAAEDATMVNGVDTLLQEEEERREQRAAQRRKREQERYQAKKDRLRQRLGVAPVVPPTVLS